MVAVVGQVVHLVCWLRRTVGSHVCTSLEVHFS